MHELNKNQEYIIVCRSGGRSARAVQFLESYGFRNQYGRWYVSVEGKVI